MSINMVGSILSVVFDNEDRGIFPIRAVRDGFHQNTNRVIIIGDKELGCRPASLQPVCVIVGEPHDRKVRHAVWLSRLNTGYILPKLLQPNSKARYPTKSLF